MPDKLNKRILLFLFTFGTFFTNAQEQGEIVTIDSLLQQPSELIETFQSQSTLDPDRAAFYSAVFPGLGQVYNRQYWKLPILYGGAIMIGHFISEKHKLYNTFRNAYIAETETGSNNLGERFTEARLQRNAEKARRDRDFLILIGAVYYILNIVDAHVAAHLSEFDINSDLSIVPSYQDNTMFARRNIGLSLKFNLNK